MHLRSDRCLLCRRLLLGNAHGFASLGGGSLLWSPLRTSISSGTLLGTSGGRLGDGGEDSRSGVSYMCGSAELNQITRRAIVRVATRIEGCKEYEPVAERVPSRAIVIYKRISMNVCC